MHKYSSGAYASSEYSHIELHRRLVNSSSVTSVGSSASICRSCPHEIIRVTAKRQKRLWFPHFLHTCPRQVETTLVLVSGPGVESSMLPRNASDGCIPHRLGSGHEWPPCSRSLKRMSPRLAHQPTGDAGRVSGPETLSPRPKRLPCVGANRQHSGDLLHQPPSRSGVTPPVQAGAPDPCVVPGQTPLTESSLHPWVSQCGSRHPVETGAIARGMDASQRGGEADLESVWPGTGGPLRYSRDSAMSPLVLLVHPAPLGLDAMVQEWPRLRLYAFPPIALLPGVLERVRRDGVRLLLVAPFWPGWVWFLDLISLLDGSHW